MSLKEKIEYKKFVVTAEIVPPKGTDVSKILENAEKLRHRIDAFNITDIQISNMRLGSLAVSSLFAHRNLEPVYQITCRDRNRLALQSDILSASVLGIPNILVLTGDYPTVGDHPQAKPVFDLDSVLLLQAVKALKNGVDMNGNKLFGKALDFFVGAVVNPGSKPFEPQLLKMEKKVSAGANFFQTQAVFDCDKFEEFIAKVKYLNVPVIAGIFFLKSAKMARFMNEQISGVEVPQELVDELEAASDKDSKCVEITARIINRIKPLCQGIHLMPLGSYHLVDRVLDAVGL